MSPETFSLVCGLLNQHILHLEKQVRGFSDPALKAEVQEEFNMAVKARDELETEYLKR